jgi:hypothetical protein
MPIRSIFQWRLILDNLPPWSAADFLLRDLLDYPCVGGQFNENVERDKQQIENFLLAYGSLSQSRRSDKTTSGPIPVLDGDLTVEEWKKVLGKLTVNAAAECVLANYLFDCRADYGYSLTVLRRVLTAWADLHANISLAAEATKLPV